MTTVSRSIAMCAVLVSALLFTTCDALIEGGERAADASATVPVSTDGSSALGASALAAVREQEPPGLSPSEVHSVHAPYGLPAGAPGTSDLIFRHSYTASANDSTRFVDWVAYVVRPIWIEGAENPTRNYRTDPFLDDDETLEASPGMGDYEGAHAAHSYDRGHLVPLDSFQSSPFAQEVNIYSVMAPQVDRLNRGPWKSLESRVRRLVEDSGEAVYVIAGPVYDDASPMPALPGANEDHLVPTAFWMVVYEGAEAATGESGIPGDDEGGASDGGAGAPGPATGPSVAAFIVPQRLPDYDGPEDFLATVDAVEDASGLDLLSLLANEVEETAETGLAEEWFASW